MDEKNLQRLISQVHVVHARHKTTWTYGQSLLSVDTHVDDCDSYMHCMVKLSQAELQVCLYTAYDHCSEKQWLITRLKETCCVNFE